MAEKSSSITADYSLTPGQLAEVLPTLIEIQQPTMVWGAPGVGKSQVAQQVTDAMGMNYIDVRALLLDPVDLRGIPWRETYYLDPMGEERTEMFDPLEMKALLNGDVDIDDAGDMLSMLEAFEPDWMTRTRWAPPVFLPPAYSDERFVINLEELPSAPPMVQVALYQLVLDRKVGEYTLPDGASIIACGNRENDRGVSHRMPTPLANRLVHLELRADVKDWQLWAASEGLAPEVLFFIQFRPELLHQFDPQAKEAAFPSPRSWEFVSRIVDRGQGLSDETMRSLVRGSVGEGAAVEFCAFLSVFGKLPHPQEILNDPEGAVVPTEASELLALCGSLYRQADEFTMEAIVRYARRLRPEVGEFLIGSCIRRAPKLRKTRAWIHWVSTADL